MQNTTTRAIEYTTISSSLKINQHHACSLLLTQWLLSLRCHETDPVQSNFMTFMVAWRLQRTKLILKLLAYFSRVFFFPVLNQFLPTKSNLCIFCARRTSRLTLFPLSTNHPSPYSNQSPITQTRPQGGEAIGLWLKQPILYYLMFLFRFIGNSKYDFLAFPRSLPQAKKFLRVLCA